MDFQKFTKNVFATISTEFFIHTLTFITTVLIVRKLSIDDFGIFSLLISLSLTLCYLSSIGLPQAIIYFIGKKKSDTERLISTLLVALLCIGIGTFIIAYLMRDYLFSTILKDLPRDYFIPMLIIYFFTLLAAFLLSIVRGLKNFKLFNLLRTLYPLSCLIGVLALYALSGHALKAFITLYVAINVLLYSAFFIFLFHKLSLRFIPDFSLVVPLISYGLKSYFQLLLGHLIYQADIYIIAYLLDARQVAFYTIAVSVATLLWYLPNTVGVVLFPELSSIRNEHEIHKISTTICRHTVMIAFFGAICLSVMGNFLIQLIYGAEYVHSIVAMLLILPGIIVMSVYKVLTRNFSSRNRQQISVMAASISLILNVWLNFILIPRFGIEGAAVASTVSYLLAGAILVIAVHRESNISIGRILFVDKADMAAYADIVSRISIRGKV